jgi:cyclopropane fatty-acyl-phospholipid synthase-like methyltransferase
MEHLQLEMEKEWFETWFDTRYYHILYGNRDYTEADGFIHNLFAHGHLKAGQKVLDLACGKGRHSIAMENLGANVLGLDLSANSIAEAAKAAKPGLRFAVHDMREKLPEADFDVVVNLFTSFGYFAHTDENKMVIQNVFDSLVPGGKFILDFLNVQRVLAEFIPNASLEREGITFNVRKHVENGVMLKDIEVHDGLKVKAYQERVQMLDANTLTKMMREAGFEIKNLLGNYQMEEYDAKASGRCILVAQKSLV